MSPVNQSFLRIEHGRRVMDRGKNCVEISNIGSKIDVIWQFASMKY